MDGIMDIAWFEEVVKNTSGVPTIQKVLKVKLDGGWHEVPTVSSPEVVEIRIAQVMD